MFYGVINVDFLSQLPESTNLCIVKTTTKFTAASSSSRIFTLIRRSNFISFVLNNFFSGAADITYPTEVGFKIGNEKLKLTIIKTSIQQFLLFFQDSETIL